MFIFFYFFTSLVPLTKRITHRSTLHGVNSTRTRNARNWYYCYIIGKIINRPTAKIAFVASGGAPLGPMIERRKNAVKETEQQSPSPEPPCENPSCLQSVVRSSRATSEARSEISPDIGAYSSPTSTNLTPAQMASFRSTRAGSEAPQRGINDTSLTTRHSQARSSRAGSEAPDRKLDTLENLSARSSRAGSEAVPSPVGATTPFLTPKRSGKAKQGAPPPGSIPHGGLHRYTRVGKLAGKLHTAGITTAEHIRDVEHHIYRTVKRSTGVFKYYQLLHYPLGQSVDDTSAVRPTAGSRATEPSKEPSPQPRGFTSPEAGECHDTSSGSPSPCFDEAAFNANYEMAGIKLDGEGDFLQHSFCAPGAPFDKTPLQAVSVLSLSTLPDLVSGAPVLGICLGDYTGQIEYLEVSTSEASNRRIRKSKSVVQPRSIADHCQSNSKRATSSYVESQDSDGTLHLTSELRGREIARRHRHQAFVKTINALTSVAVEPSVKCLSFTGPHSSPSLISYLTANDRVIKLFHVRRENFSCFHAFPGMEEIIGRQLVDSRYFARLPPPINILPIKEFGPTSNSIQSLSLSADGETFMSVEDLQVHWWNLEAADTTKATCIADLLPPSGAVDEVEELVTAASFHPTHSSLFMLSRSSGVLNIGDLRDPPSRDKRQFAITTRVLPTQNPITCPSYDEILCSISAAAFLSPDHVVTRDYLSLKLWDLRRPDTPYAMTPVMNYVSKYLDALYEQDSIFDRFSVVVDDISGTVVTGLYDGAVAVWQPLSPSVSAEDSLVHYRVDPTAEPSDVGVETRASVQDLEKRLDAAWSPAVPAHAEEAGAFSAKPEEEMSKPFNNKVLNIAIAPGGERFAYTLENGRLVCIFERAAATSTASQ